MLTILEQLASFAKSLRSDLTKLHDAINKQTEAIHENADAYKNRSNTPPVIRSEFQIPETIKTHRTRDDTQKRGEEIFKIIIQVLTLLFVGAYTVLTYDLLQVSHDSLVSVQRAFLASKGTQNERFLNTMPDGSRWVFEESFTNDGSTPAIQVTQLFHAQEFPDGLTEKDFMGDEKDAANAKETSGIVAPKEPYTIGPIFKPEEFVMGGYKLNWNQKATVSAVKIDRNVFFWGWVIYSDVFPKTPRHLTEFCQQLSGILVNPKDKTIRLIFQNCGEHNCTDEYCGDYKQLMNFIANAKKLPTRDPFGIDKTLK